MSQFVTEITSETFSAEVLETSQPVLVDFSAPWCSPCRAINPMIDELAREYAGVAKVAKVNIDDAPHLVSTYNITSIPALLLFRDGNVVRQFLGIQPKQKLKAAIDDLAIQN